MMDLHCYQNTRLTGFLNPEKVVSTKLVYLNPQFLKVVLGPRNSGFETPNCWGKNSPYRRSFFYYN